MPTPGLCRPAGAASPFSGRGLRVSGSPWRHNPSRLEHRSFVPTDGWGGRLRCVSLPSEFPDPCPITYPSSGRISSDRATRSSPARISSGLPVTSAGGSSSFCHARHTFIFWVISPATAGLTRLGGHSDLGHPPQVVLYNRNPWPILCNEMSQGAYWG